MEENSVNHLLLKTAFCCMACDGEIAPEEIALIKSICREIPALQQIDFEKEINLLVTSINFDSKEFLSDFFKTIKQNAPDLIEQEELALIEIAINVIKADNKIEYSEIKFFKAIRYCFKVSDDRIISHFSKSVEDIELFLGKDIQTSFESITQQYFNSFNFDVLQMLK